MPHKTSITHQLETDIPGSSPNPPDLLDTQDQKFTVHSKNWVCWPLEQEFGFREEDKKTSPFPVKPRRVGSKDNVKANSRRPASGFDSCHNVSFFWVDISGLSGFTDRMEGMNSEEFLLLFLKDFTVFCFWATCLTSYHQVLQPCKAMLYVNRAMCNVVDMCNRGMCAMYSTAKLYANWKICQIPAALSISLNAL